LHSLVARSTLLQLQFEDYGLQCYRHKPFELKRYFNEAAALMSSEDKSRPPIPLPIQREVRQRCGFGCVICGHPLIDYHHIVPFADCQEHEAINLTALCTNHHREATNGLLTIDAVRAADATPINRTRGVSSPFHLHFSGNEISFGIGNNRVSGGFSHPEGGVAFVALSVDDCDILWFRVDNLGNVLMNATILDQCNLPVLAIFENALVFRTDGWDISFQGRSLVLRNAPRDIFLEVEFVPPHHIRIVRGRLLCNGIELLVDTEGFLVVNSGQIIKNSDISGGAIGIQLGRNERGLPACIGTPPEGLNRYGVDRDAMIAEARRRERVWRQLRNNT
jgi:hypothetical protein